MINIPNSLTILRIIGASFIPFILLIDAKEWGCFIVLIIFFLCSIVAKLSQNRTKAPIGAAQNLS